MCFLFILRRIFIHETFLPASCFLKKSLLRDGAYHYTTRERAAVILQQQMLIGSDDVKNTIPMLRNIKLVWLLPVSKRPIDCYFRKQIIRRHCPIHPTGQDHQTHYEVKLWITNLSSNHIRRIRCNLEGALSYRGKTLTDVQISLAPLDDIDITLGITALKERDTND